MAKEGQRKRLASNTAALKLYFQAACIATIAHVGIRYFIRYGSLSGWTVIGSAVLCGCMALAYQHLKKAAEATYGPPPEFQLVDAGADLSKPSSALGIAKDLLWSAVILLPLVAVTDYGWFVAAVVPVYAGVTVWKKVAPMLGGAGAGDAEPAPGPGNRKQKRAEMRKKAKG